MAQRPSAGEVRPTLVADDGRVIRSFAAIPAPPDQGEVLRVAFAAAADVLSTETVFSLEFPDFYVVALPAPTAGTMRGNQPGAPDAPVLERRTDLQPKLVELSEELAETRQETSDLRTASDTARAQTAQARSQLLDLQVVAAIQSAELQAVRDLAELKDAEGPALTTAAAPADAEDLRDRLTAAERQRDAADEARQAVEADAEQLRARVAELEVWTAELERRLGDTTTELANARPKRPDEALSALAEAASADAHAEAVRALARASTDGD